jgi:hypothetical protein
MVGSTSTNQLVDKIFLSPCLSACQEKEHDPRIELFENKVQ